MAYEPAALAQPIPVPAWMPSCSSASDNYGEGVCLCAASQKWSGAARPPSAASWHVLGCPDSRRLICASQSCATSTSLRENCCTWIPRTGRITVLGHRVTGDPRDHARGAGCEVIHSAIDDHSGLCFVQVSSGWIKVLGGGVPQGGGGVLPGAGGDHQASDHRQRAGLSLATVCAYLPSTGHQAHLHPPLPSPDQQ